MALSNFDKQTFTTAKPAVEGRPYVDQWDRSGNSVAYTINFSANTKSSGGWRNNPWYVSIWVGSTLVADHKKVKNNTSGAIGTTEYYMSGASGHAAGSLDLGTPAAGTQTIRCQMFDNWNYNNMGTKEWSWSYGGAPLWNDINAYTPDGSTQNGLMFNLTTSDGGSWTNITNEPEGFTKTYGTTATISNIRSNTTGAHYTKNSVTGGSDGTITWTFTTPDYVVHLYSAWDTYTISYNANGGTGAPGNQTKTYGTNLTLSSTKPTRGNSTATGYTVTFNGNGGTASKANQSATNTTSYTFNNWKDGAGTTYAAGGTYTKNQADTLTAQWNTSTTKGAITTATASRSNSTSTRTVTFNANGGTTNKTSQNSTATVTYSCTGWFTAASGGTKRAASGGSYTPSASETVYAQWSSSTGSYSAVTLPTAAQCTRNGYKLLGFATSSTATTAAYAPGASYTPSATITLYAVWELAQANLYTKKSGAWVKGPAYVKVGGAWKVAKQVYTKVNGAWVLNK